MAGVRDFKEGGYRYIKAVFQYSGGIAALPGFEVERARLLTPVPLEEGFSLIENHLQAIGRPIKAFAACELRSPAPFTEQGFKEFNLLYATTLERWGLWRDGDNPVARTNVCPMYDPPAVPSLHAFSYLVPSRAPSRGSFIVAGGGEAQEGRASYKETIVRPGDTSLEGMREKVRYVMGEMERRLAALGFGWKDAISTQAYTVYDIGPLVGDEIVRKGAAGGGLAWHFCRPPIVGLDYEMDVRGAAREIVLQ
ncbi:MAG: 2-amino-5-chloromuconate deaminase CnbZ [Betaproteobacteria bacterium]